MKPSHSGVGSLDGVGPIRMVDVRGGRLHRTARRRRGSYTARWKRSRCPSEGDRIPESGLPRSEEDTGKDPLETHRAQTNLPLQGCGRSVSRGVFPCRRGWASVVERGRRARREEIGRTQRVRRRHLRKLESMFPHARFLSAALLAAAALASSSCSSQGGSEEEFHRLLTENGLTAKELRITPPDANGFWWATYDATDDCQLQFKWDGGEQVTLYGAHTDGYLLEAPEDTFVENLGPGDVKRACEGDF